MTPQQTFQYEVEKSEGEHGMKVTKVRCHGRLVAGNSGQIGELVKPLIPEGGRVIIDLGDLSYLDSSGLGALVALKASAIRQGYCMLELANMTPRVLELLRITNLMQLFAS
jgi:anti-anti-sigma factor